MIRLRVDSVTWQVVDDEIVCLDLEGSRYFAVNAAGATLWSQLAAGAELTELIATLQSTFALDEQTARRDVEDFVGVLAERRLLAPD